MQFQAQWIEIDIGQNETLNVGVSREIQGQQMFWTYRSSNYRKAAYSNCEFEVTFFSFLFHHDQVFGEKGKALNCRCRNAIDFDLFLVYYLQYGASSNKTRITAIHK